MSGHITLLDEIDKSNERIKELEQQLNQSNKERAELERKLSTSLEALEFYADKDNYVPRRSNSDIFSSIKGDNSIDLNRVAYGGKRAREALAKINQK